MQIFVKVRVVAAARVAPCVWLSRAGCCKVVSRPSGLQTENLWCLVALVHVVRAPRLARAGGRPWRDRGNLCIYLSGFDHNRALGGGWTALTRVVVNHTDRTSGARAALCYERARWCGSWMWARQRSFSHNW